MPPAAAAAVACCVSHCQSDAGRKNGVRSNVDFRTRRKKKVVPCAKSGLGMPYSRGPSSVPNEIKGIPLKASQIRSGGVSTWRTVPRGHRQWVKNTVGRKSRSRRRACSPSPNLSRDFSNKHTANTLYGPRQKGASSFGCSSSRPNFREIRKPRTPARTVVT